MSTVRAIGGPDGGGAGAGATAGAGVGATGVTTGVVGLSGLGEEQAMTTTKANPRIA